MNESASGDPAVRIMLHFIEEREPERFASGNISRRVRKHATTGAAHYDTLKVASHGAASRTHGVDGVSEPQFPAEVSLRIKPVLAAKGNQGVKAIKQQVAQKVLWDYQAPGVSFDIADIVGLDTVAHIETARIGERMQQGVAKSP